MTDQMERVSKFLWLPWMFGQVCHYQTSPGGQLTYWEGAHDGYKRLRPPVCHRRGIVRLGDESWFVLDALRSTGVHRYRLHWLFPAMPYAWDAPTGGLTLYTPAGPYHIRLAALSGQGCSSLVRADEHSPRGWQAPYYSYREPALSVDLVQEGHTAWFGTLFGPEAGSLVNDTRTVHIGTPSWDVALQLQRYMQEPLITAIRAVGALEDKLALLDTSALDDSTTL
jgi:hypothetical protein